MKLWSLTLVAALPIAGCFGSPSAVAPHSGASWSRELPLAQGELLGCSYPSGRVWQHLIAGVKPARRSAAYIKATIDGGGGAGFLATMPTYEYVNMADNSTPLVTVHPLVGYERPYSPIPWESYFYISPLSDEHSIVLQSQKCKYYEGYETTYDSSTGLTMFNNTHVNLNRPFKRPATGALSTSSGIPLGLLAVRAEELAAGVIPHALGWNVVSGSVSQWACVSPAGKRSCTNGARYAGPSSDTPMPWGSHARLRASFDISNFHREAKILATAMQTYGLYVYDAGCCNEIVLTDDVNGSPEWSGYDANDLETISPADFEIVPPP
jgi:hypothetical protein